MILLLYIVGKLLKDHVIPARIGITHITQLYVSATETEMVVLTLDDINDCCEFSEALTSYRLSEPHDKKLISTGEVLHPLVSFMSLYNVVKDSLKKKADELQ